VVRRILLAVLILAAAGGYTRSLEARRVAAVTLPALGDIPAFVDGWTSRDFRIEDEIQAVLGADAYLYREYSNVAGQNVNLFVAYFADQEVGSQIHSPRNCLPGAGWSIRGISKTSIEVPSGRQAAHRMVIAKGDRTQEVLYWFETRSGTVTGEYALKWDLVRNSLARRPTDAAFVRYMAYGPDVAAMRSLVAELDAPLMKALGGAGLR